MKATFEFTLPEEQEEFEEHCKAREYCSALDEISNLIRSYFKYGESDLAKAEQLLETVRRIAAIE